MYIRSIIIDGFKSYGRRTELTGFDPEFTAITGLNGTGKSNILDSICFVLGILNLGQVRATSLQDLVYKNGQAGITKATVTVIFDNTNPNQCPLGYEKCREISVTRQIVVGGKNKYLINGKLVQNKKVSDFFCSVQLNVNNPNFLIMQGRITKVLNMKPQEILSMIEEAAGTSLYETKREATTKLIEKKDAKVRETNTLLQEEVLPKLEKLRKERAAHTEYQSVCREIEHLTRISVSFRYLKQKEALRGIEENIQKLKARIEKCRSTIAQNEEECTRIDSEADSLQKEIDSRSGGALKKLEEELTVKQATEATASGQLKALKSNISKEEKNLRNAEKSISDDEKLLGQKEAVMANAQGMFQKLQENDANDALAYEESQKKFEAVTKGLTMNEDGQASSLQDQLIAAKREISEAQTFLKTTQLEMRHCRTVLAQKENETQTTDAAYTKDKRLQDELTAEMTRLSKKLADVRYEDGAYERLEQRKQTLQRELRELKAQQDARAAYQFAMDYRDPEPNFNRSKVHGLVGKLFNVRNSKHFLALSMAGGGNIHSFVTDDDTTSKKILQRGQLKRRVTIIPINKISSYPVDQNVVQFAQRLVGKENVQSALSLIDYDRYFEPVMQFVFGSTLICRDLNIAKQVTYHREVRCRSVTLEGDVVDPEGTLSGGAAPKGECILQRLAAIKHCDNEIQARQAELAEVEQQLSSLTVIVRTYNKIKESIALRQHELDACMERLRQTTVVQHKEEIVALKQQIASMDIEFAAASEKGRVAEDKAKDIEAKLADSKGHRERELKRASEAMQAAKKKAEQSRSKWKQHEQKFETLKMEIEELTKSIESGRQQRDEMNAKLEKFKSDYEELQQSSASAIDQTSNLKKLIQQEKERLASQNREIRAMLGKKEERLRQNEQMNLEIKKKESEVTKVHNENGDSLRKLEDMEKKYTWLQEEEQFFGRKNTRYDYSKSDPMDAGRKLGVLRTKKDEMERHLNFRAMALLEREEEHYNETMRRKEIVEQDKEKIKRIICKMDEKKREKVENAWKVVNDNFSNIFSTLLPGAQACLNAVKLGNQLAGLEIKVGFNGIWKDSLGELSGGQRSLVALSLVLAMLKFSPAPLYILDEIDAALDMSHTQNIGGMLKKHFTSSQFIIVSLKDGMFNNANVLLRTKFEEGVSMVTRTVNARAMNRQ